MKETKRLSSTNEDNLEQAIKESEAEGWKREKRDDTEEKPYKPYKTGDWPSGPCWTQKMQRELDSAT